MNGPIEIENQLPETVYVDLGMFIYIYNNIFYVFFDFTNQNLMMHFVQGYFEFYRKDTEPFILCFHVLTSKYFFPVSIHSCNVIHCLLQLYLSLISYKNLPCTLCVISSSLTLCYKYVLGSCV